MKAILKNQGDRYVLYYESGHKIATTDKSPYKKLSMKNCKSIEYGYYDLNELVERNSKYSEEDWGDGFLFAMNLVGDKKYTEEDLRKAYQKGEEDSYLTGGLNKTKEDKFIQSLQQTEFDVEIELEYIGECNGNNGNGCFHDSSGHNCGCLERREKIDADGCLILKRI